MSDDKPRSAREWAKETMGRLMASNSGDMEDDAEIIAQALKSYAYQEAKVLVDRVEELEKENALLKTKIG